MLNMPGKDAMGENVREGKRKGLSERDAVLTSMRMAKKPKMEEMSSPSPVQEEQYPYGLKVNLEHDDMKKLGIKKLPKAGDIHKFTAHAKVTRAEESSSVDGGKKRSVTIRR